MSKLIDILIDGFDAAEFGEDFEDDNPYGKGTKEYHAWRLGHEMFNQGYTIDEPNY